jgi:16S rRNA (uracil1498-N3)-methyltransferase
MSRELRRLLIEPERLAATGGEPALLPAERHYLERVLRLRVGERLAVTDGAGHLWTAELRAGGKLALEQQPAAPLLCEAPPVPPLQLAMALPKREAGLVWRMATELGADRLQPLLARRCVRPGKAPLERWGAVVREASEQCERLWLPALATPQPAQDWLSRPPEGVGLLATTRRAGLGQLAAVLATRAGHDDDGWRTGAGGGLALISLAIGPEGGWTDEEEAAAEAAGWIAVSLGPTILRTPTAAVSGLAALAAWRQLSSSSFPSPSP